MGRESGMGASPSRSSSDRVQRGVDRLHERSVESCVLGNAYTDDGLSSLLHATTRGRPSASRVATPKPRIGGNRTR